MAAMPELDRESSRLSTGSKSRTSRARNAAHRVSYRGASKLKHVASHARARTEGDKSDAAAEAEAANAQIKGFEGVFPVPAAGCRPKPPAALSPSQQVALDGMLSHFRDTKQFPTSLKPEAEQREANDWEKLRLLSRESLLRYLRASKWDLSTAKKRLTDTIAWRREFGVDDLVDDEMSEEAKCGKETVLGYDKHARPLHYMHPHRNDTKVSREDEAARAWAMARTRVGADPAACPVIRRRQGRCSLPSGSSSVPSTSCRRAASSWRSSSTSTTAAATRRALPMPSSCSTFSK